MPAQAGIQGKYALASGYASWIPAFAGMTAVLFRGGNSFLVMPALRQAQDKLRRASRILIRRLCHEKYYP